mmetsp:Transcript_12242/g.18585  ORF Transcript_12242/g.18585 Transcript_12242/m.18585 type:complete len:683 (+) Transcript_12242:32-2080(+)
MSHSETDMNIVTGDYGGQNDPILQVVEGREEDPSIYYYVDYSDVPPTEEDRDNYMKKLQYYKNKRDHASERTTEGRKQTTAEQQQQSVCYEEEEHYFRQDSTSSHTHDSTRSSQRGEEDDFFLDAENFKRPGRGNTSKNKIKVPAASFPPCPSNRSGVLDDNNNNNRQHGVDDQEEFIGFMGTNFPARLHDLISKPSLTRLENDSVGSCGDQTSSAWVICWLPHGRSWIVRNEIKFIESVAKTHFNLRHYKSFNRQVTGWGFKRVTKGPDTGSYFHPLFLRGMPHLTAFMRRKSASRRKKFCCTSAARDLACYGWGKIKIKIDDINDPDFYTISKEHPIPNHYAAIINKYKRDAATSRCCEERENMMREDDDLQRVVEEYVTMNPNSGAAQGRNDCGNSSSSSWPPLFPNIHSQRQQHQLLTSEQENNEDNGYYHQQQKKAKSDFMFPKRMLLYDKTQLEVRKYQNNFFHDGQQSPKEYPLQANNNIEGYVDGEKFTDQFLFSEPFNDGEDHSAIRIPCGREAHYQELPNDDSLISSLRKTAGATCSSSSLHPNRNEDQISPHLNYDQGADVRLNCSHDNGKDTKDMYQKDPSGLSFLRRNSDSRIYSYRRGVMALSNRGKYREPLVLANAEFGTKKSNSGIVQCDDDNSDKVIKSFFEDLLRGDDNIQDFSKKIDSKFRMN